MDPAIRSASSYAINANENVYIFYARDAHMDTRVSRENITGVFISDIVLQLLSYVAQVERERIRQRQAEGIAAARARGVHL